MTQGTGQEVWPDPLEVSLNPPPERECPECHGTKKVQRETTLDHILTDMQAWSWCPTCNGKGRIPL